MKQIDMFAQAGQQVTLPQDRAARHAKWAAELERSTEYRVLRRLVPRPSSQEPLSGTEQIGVIVDVETTGLDHAKAEIIELGMVAFTYDESGNFLRVLDTFSQLQQPSSPIPEEITCITGITDDMVSGMSIDVNEATSFINDASIVIAHNARFDRPFCEALAEAFSFKAWACSLSEIDWSALGFEGAKLGYLLNQFGWFHNGHRASDDCHALLAILSTPLPTGSGNGLRLLVCQSASNRDQLWRGDRPARGLSGMAAPASHRPADLRRASRFLHRGGSASTRDGDRRSRLQSGTPDRPR